MGVEFLDCLKRERDISIKAMPSGGKMAFRLNPPLRAPLTANDNVNDIDSIYLFLLLRRLRNVVRFYRLSSLAYLKKIIQNKIVNITVEFSIYHVY